MRGGGSGIFQHQPDVLSFSSSSRMAPQQMDFQTECCLHDDNPAKQKHPRTSFKTKCSKCTGKYCTQKYN